MRKLYPFTCLFCHCTFESRQKTPHYCSRTCSNRATISVRSSSLQKPAHQHSCSLCGGTFTSKSSSRKFCSRKCSAAVGTDYVRKNGHFGRDGYHYIYVNGRLTREHRHVMSVHLGRELLPAEVVHHINGDRADNRIDNLKLMASQQDHMAIHMPSSMTCDNQKRCSKCKEVKPLSEFTKRPKLKTTPYDSQCKSCCREWQQNFRQTERYAEYMATRRANVRK